MATVAKREAGLAGILGRADYALGHRLERLGDGPVLEPPPGGWGGRPAAVSQLGDMDRPRRAGSLLVVKGTRDDSLFARCLGAD